MKTFLLLTCFFLSIASNAQNSSSINSKTDSVYYKTPFFSLHPVIMKNEKKLTKNEAASLFSQVPNAEVLYEKYRRNYKIGVYSFFGGVIAGFILSNIGFEKGNRTWIAVGLPFAVYSFFGGITFMSIGEGKLRKAIKSYNKSVLKY